MDSILFIKNRFICNKVMIFPVRRFACLWPPFHFSLDNKVVISRPLSFFSALDVIFFHIYFNICVFISPLSWFAIIPRSYKKCWLWWIRNESFSLQVSGEYLNRNTMELILDGNSKIGAPVRSNLCYLTMYKPFD